MLKKYFSTLLQQQCFYRGGTAAIQSRERFRIKSAQNDRAVNDALGDVKRALEGLSKAINNREEILLRTIEALEESQNENAELKRQVRQAEEVKSTRRDKIAQTAKDILLKTRSNNPVPNVELKKQLFEAVSQGDLVVSRSLLLKQQIDVNVGYDKNLGTICSSNWSNGVTPLMVAVVSGKSATVQMLVEEFKANVDAKETEQGRTALMFAAQWGHFEIADFLVKSGAKIDELNKNGKSALDLANNNNGKIKELLMPKSQ